MWKWEMRGLTPAALQLSPVVHIKEPPTCLLKMPLSSGLVSAIVIVVIVLLVIVAAIVYMIFIRRCDPSGRQRVDIDTGGAAMFVARPSVIVRDEDVVYSGIKHKPSRDPAVSSNEKHTADDVMYSEVFIFHQQPPLDEMYV
ncbi:uncharacterized protein LOC130212956 isoform X2 [Pseudoliparis swirei]|uniref:uncharacterized protein LOC130212956 isoform X2 n=1 Tax=Pseudoliparis swirei TaxID=2059687 RepID=UPI0024BE9383|nr:uncharacterized protein LOC130212956 isoform X2 [Pseudoliparis swirei]